MKIYFSVILPVLLISSFSRCATITYHEKFGRAGDEMAEFNDFNEKHKMFKGSVIDENHSYKGKKFYQLQFSGPLAGTGRLLTILIPHDYKTDPEIYETSGSLPEGKKAYLLVVRNCCSEEYHGVFDPLQSRETEKNIVLMKKYLMLKFPESSSRDQWPVVFCELSLANVKTYNLIYKKWNPVASDKDISVYGSALEVPYSKMGLKWEERSRVKNVMIKAGYIFPVIIDIVTSPVQLAGFIIYYAAGGAVK